MEGYDNGGYEGGIQLTDSGDVENFEIDSGGEINILDGEGEGYCNPTTIIYTVQPPEQELRVSNEDPYDNADETEIILETKDTLEDNYSLSHSHSANNNNNNNHNHINNENDIIDDDWQCPHCQDRLEMANCVNFTRNNLEREGEMEIECERTPLQTPSSSSELSHSHEISGYDDPNEEVFLSQRKDEENRIKKLDIWNINKGEEDPYADNIPQKKIPLGNSNEGYITTSFFSVDNSTV